MLAGLPRRSLLLMDAGFTGFDLLNGIISSGHDFIIRAGANVTLLEGLAGHVEDDGDTVWLWPLQYQRHCRPLRLRKVRICRKGRPICLLTNVESSAILPNAEIKNWYRRRWDVEIQYRSLKQTMQHRRLLSQTPEMARAELDWAVLGLWLLQLMLVRHQPRTRRYSIASGLRVIRQALHSLGAIRAGGLAKQLRQAVQDSYTRHGPKQARGWPHKKNVPPCSMPNVRIATERERQQAKACWT